MKIGEFVVTVGITAAISIPATYHISAKNRNVDPCEASSSQQAGDSLDQPSATADPAREQAYSNSSTEDTPITRLPSRNEKAPPALSEHQHESEEKAKEQASEHEETNVNYEEFEKRQKEIAQIRIFSENHDTGSHNRILQKRYDAEEVDYSWAVNREAELLNLFGTEEGLEYAVPTSLSCRSSSCQVIIPVSGEQQTSSIYRAFNEAVAKNSTDSERPVVSYFPDSDGNELILYISRNGRSDLFE